MHEQHIVHMDMKPGNILLDFDMNPKITDFNLSLVLDADVYTAGISGTFQYMPPEYVMRGITSTSNDVYAFGVTLFKTVGCMCRSKQTRETSPCPFSWAWEAWQSGEIEELFIPSLAGFMADPVVTVEKIIKIGLKIKEAVDKVRQNKEACLEIRKRVLRYSTMLSQLQQRGVLHNNPEMSGALEDLAETLERALELVMACQERSTISHFVSAGDLSKQLRQMKESISEQVILSLWALNVHNTMVLLAMQDVIPLSRQPEAVLNDGNVVAVKIFPKQRKNFPMPMIDHVVKLQHKNIVKVLGYCYGFKHQQGVDSLYHRCFERWHPYSCSCSNSQQQPALNNGPVIEAVYWVEECVPNGSLHDITMHGKFPLKEFILFHLLGSQLEWSSAFRIIEGVAQAVHYLHEQQIVHMDVTPSNILLDSDMNPKITDFELSIVLDADESNADEIRGTIGFFPPEYLLRCIISTKHDVYAFGATLLETLSCICRSRPTRDPLYKWAWKAWQSGEVEGLFNPSLFHSSQLMEIRRCMGIGLLCIQHDRTTRPTMKDVIEMLNGDEELPTPKTPGYMVQDEGWLDGSRSP
ncbi:hypothetical protein EJB05_50083, partial [Eragrostis curvula]